MSTHKLRFLFLGALLWLGIPPASAQLFIENPLPPRSVIGNSVGVGSNAGAILFTNLLQMQLNDSFGLSQGLVLYRSASGWAALPPGSNGQLLATGGPSANPSWVTANGTGTLTSLSAQAGVVANPSPITGAGTVSLDGNYTGFANSNCTIAASVSAGALTVALKDHTLSDPTAASPCLLNFRNGSANNGLTSLVQQTSSLSISTPTSGATLGSSNNTAFRFWVVAINNSGTIVLGLINCSSSAGIFPLNEAQLISSTPISGTATSPGTFYTPSGVTVTSMPFRILGYIEYNSIGLATAGTFASAPSVVQMFGPGVARPGQVVQSVYGSPIGQTGISATSFATVLNSAFPTITPTSAVNPIRYNVVVLGSVNNVASTNTVVTAIFARGTTAIGSSMSGLASGTNIGIGWNGTLAFSGVDLPNSASAQTYQLQAHASGSGALVGITNISGAIDEIQG